MITKVIKKWFMDYGMAVYLIELVDWQCILLVLKGVN